MKKMLIIENCNQCPHYQYIDGMGQRCVEIKDWLNARPPAEGILPGCPLPNAPKRLGKAGGKHV